MEKENEVARPNRAQLLKEMARTEYGERPGMEYEVSWDELVRETIEELGAVHIRTALTVRTGLGEHSFPVTVYLPQDEGKRVPAALLICSQQREAKARQIPPGAEGKAKEEVQKAFMELVAGLKIRVDDEQALAGLFDGQTAGTPDTLDLDRDYDRGHFPVREMVKRGVAMVGFYATEAEPDSGTGGLSELFGTGKDRAENEWGTIAVWAFAAQCVMEYVRSIPQIDPGRVAVAGHSRCGKAALWCGANDERFDAVFSNDSGCCGAALSRNKKGENLAAIQTFFPHWLAPAFRRYMGKEEELPFDQDSLLGTIAPRVLHVASGSEDFWSDPAAEHQSVVLAAKAWEAYGESAGIDEALPAPDGMQISGKIGYHLRRGGHALETFDWLCFLEHWKQAMPL